VIGPRRQAEVGRVGLDDDDAAAEPLSELSGPLAVGFDGDHPGASAHQRLGDGTPSRADVDDERAGRKRRAGDERVSPLAFELVPTPRPWRSHGDGPS
jgi:hypothetical protein